MIKHKFNVCTGEQCATAFVDHLTLCGQDADQAYQMLLEEFASIGVFMHEYDRDKLRADVHATTDEVCAGMGSEL